MFLYSLCESGGMVYTADLKSAASGLRVRVPSLVPIGLKVFMDAHSTVTAEEGDRYPLRPPNL